VARRGQRLWKASRRRHVAEGPAHTPGEWGFTAFTSIRETRCARRDHGCMSHFTLLADDLTDAWFRDRDMEVVRRIGTSVYPGWSLVEWRPRAQH